MICPEVLPWFPMARCPYSTHRRFDSNGQSDGLVSAISGGQRAMVSVSSDLGVGVKDIRDTMVKDTPPKVSFCHPSLWHWFG